MEEKQVLLSAALLLGLGVGLGILVDQIGVLLEALSVGIGLCVGLAIWVVVGFGGDHVSNQVSSEDQTVMEELMKLVIDGKDSEVTFDKFPYYLSERIKILLTSAGYFHLKQHDSSKHTRNLSPVTRAILLSGPAEFYQEELAKALAHYFESKLLFLDVNYFSSKAKYGCPTKEPYFKRSISEATLECVSGLFSSLSILPSTGAIRAPSKSTSRYSFDEKLFLDSLYKVLVSISDTGSVILYIKNVEKIFLQSPRMYSLFQQLLNKLSGSVLVLGSRNYDLKDKCIKVDGKLTMLFPYNIDIKPPQDEAHLKIWKSQLKEATKKTQLKDYTIRVAEVLAANDLDCDDLDTISHTDMMLLKCRLRMLFQQSIYSFRVLKRRCQNRKRIWL